MSYHCRKFPYRACGYDDNEDIEMRIIIVRECVRCVDDTCPVKMVFSEGTGKD